MVGLLRLLESSDAKAIGRHGNVPPVTCLDDGVRFPSVALLVTFAATLVPAPLLTSPTMIAVICATLLLGGLPHGALDLAILRREAPDQTDLMITLYLGLAAVMFATWQIVPLLALGLFLAMAIVHFAEDWSVAEHPFFAIGIAVATLSAPALFHHAELGEAFVLFTGQTTAFRLADTLLLVAPVAAACALLAMLLLWQAGNRVTAVNAACALAAMVALPPVIGFAIYFCLIHSPMHFRAGLRRLAPAAGITRSTIVATLGGCAIAFATLQIVPTADPSGGAFVASFMTLSILTLPHMAVPMIVRRLGFSAQT